MSILDIFLKEKEIIGKGGMVKKVKYMPEDRYVKTAAQARTEALRERANRGLLKKKVRKQVSSRRYLKSENGRYEHRATNNHSNGESKTRRLMAKKSRRINRRRK